MLSTNLLHNSALIRDGFEHDGRQPVGVIWLPPYHDMGLIGGILQPLYAGFPVVLMSPLAFLQRPLRWLEAISALPRRPSAAGPTSPTTCALRKLDRRQERAALDLRRWQVAFNGAEPVRADDARPLRRGASRRAASGREAFYPCYGLAEATLMVTGGRRGRAAVVPPATRRTPSARPAVGRRRGAAPARVGCGGRPGRSSVIVVDPATARRVADDRVGEIWVAGPSVARGLLGPIRPTGETFARVARRRPATAVPAHRRPRVPARRRALRHRPPQGPDHHLPDGTTIPRTSSVTVGAAHPALRPGSCAAFAVPTSDGERVAVAREVRPTASAPEPAEAITAIRQALSEAHEMRAFAVVLLQAGAMPKTSSGKIQRHACRDGFRRHARGPRPVARGRRRPRRSPAPRRRAPIRAGS